MNTLKDILDLCAQHGSLYDVALHYEQEQSQLSHEMIISKMKQQLQVMKASIERGNKGVSSHTGLTGNDAKRLDEYISSGNTLCNPVMLKAVRNAMATNEVNASMGLICATPTAGSAGIVPGVLCSLIEHYNLSEQKQVEYLFVAALIGLIIANNASISGAMGGCQAEVGSASAMASAATVHVLGGTPNMSIHAAAITIKNMLGLICDPVAGLVEVPCIKRNALGATQALVSADMALAGITSRIDPDDVISAMDHVGKAMPSVFKETALGGLATTDSGLKIAQEIFND